MNYIFEMCAYAYLKYIYMMAWVIFFSLIFTSTISIFSPHSGPWKLLSYALTL